MSEQHLTGYPSIDKPWLKYYTEEQINSVIPEKLVYDYMRDRNTENLDRTAITFMGQEYTYAQLFEIIDRTADALLSLGVREGEVVTMLLPICPEEVFLFYAINRIGAISNFLMPATPLEKVSAIMAEHESRFLFAFPQFLPAEAYIYAHTDCENIVLVQGVMECNCDQTLSWDAFLQKADACQRRGYKTKKSPKETMFLAKTGGTTGASKSVMLSDNAFNAAVDQIITAIKEYAVGDRWLRLWPAFSATVAVAAIHLPLSVGMNVIAEPLYDHNEFDRLIMRYKPNHLAGVPMRIEQLMASPLVENEDLSFLKVVGVGGSGMTEDFELRANKFFKEHNCERMIARGYGMTENASTATTNINNETAKKSSVGIPAIHTVVSVFDPESFEEKHYGEIGEICIQAPQFMNGYWKQPELSKQIFRTHKNGSLWLHSGDLGYMDEDGVLYVKGRMKSMIFLYHTAKIYPADMETALSKVTGIRAVTVVAEPDKEHEGYFMPAFFVEPYEGFRQEDILRNIENEYLANETVDKRPQNIYVLDKLPLTSMGKPDLKLLEEMAKNSK